MSTKSSIPILTVADCLEAMEEEPNMFLKRSRTNGFQNLHLILKDNECCEKTTSQEVLRILAVFEKYLKLDIQSIPHALTAVLSLLTNAKVVPNLPYQYLMPSALAVLHMLKSLCALETQHLRSMGVQVLLAYPVDVLTIIVRNNCSEVLEIFEDYAPQIQQGVSKQLHTFISGLLIKLPSQEKKQLMQEGLPIWFKVISVIMDVCATATEDNGIILNYIECLEVLTEALIEVDYFQCPQWQTQVLKCICDSTYPATILRQLKRNYCEWHRFWIVFVKLLKNQITRNSTYGTPIQPMLAVVENAFKMDSDNRCRAFQCWDVLIDTLSKDTNAKSTARYLKLILVPLRPNNAKTEDSVQAKFYTWWNLIRKFQGKFDQFTNEILLEFLHFMFGKKAYDKKHIPYQVVAGAGQTYDSIKSLCLQAYTEIVGHDKNCDCCTDITKLNEKMLNNKLLASHWDEWMCALKTAILIANTMYKTDNDKVTNEQMNALCVWKAFVIAIAELPPNGVRKDMFNELIQVLIDLLKVCKPSDTLPNVLFSLILYLMEDNDSIRKLLVVLKEDEQPICKIMSIIVNPKMAGVVERYDTTKLVEILKPLLDIAVDSLNKNCCLTSLMDNISSLKLWSALAHSINNAQKCTSAKTLRQMLTWPVQAIQRIDEQEMQQPDVCKYAAAVWQTLYNTYMTKSSNTEFDTDICELIEANKKSSYFKAFVAICTLKNRLLSHEDAGIYTKILENITAEIMCHYKLYEHAVPILVETIVLILDKVALSSDEKLAKVSFNCVKNVLLMFFSEIKQHDNDTGYEIDASIIVMLTDIFKAIQPINKIPLFSQFFCDFLEVLRSYAPLNKDLLRQENKFCQESDLFKLILSKMNYLQQNCPIDIVKMKIDECIEIMNNSNKSANNKSRTVFTSPKVNKVVKRSKRKEAIIVDTVTENGEEYAVVKSNWKFNPKMLTENQKEKLQRKREDIPALYQDLSQSQDEFKLSKWKTDSQDTTTSSNSKSSKLTTNDDASNILKNIECSDVVPNIMQNILSENDKNHTNASKEIKTVCVLQTNRSDKVQSSPKNTKSPRMALKDRVFRNVRNLIEKSSPINDTTNTVIDECQQTPSAKTTNNANINYPLTSADRPSRVKRIPKKFADVQLFGLKKRRYSQTESPSHLQNDIEILDDVNQDGGEKNTDKAQLSIDNGNAVNFQSTAEHCDITEVKEAESVNNVEKIMVIPVSQREDTNSALDKLNTDNLSCTQNDEHTSKIQKNYNDLNSDNNNEHDKHQNKDAEKKFESHAQELQKNDEAQSIPNEGAAQEIQINDNDNSHPCQRNDDAQEALVNGVAQDNNKNKLKDKVTVVKDTVDLNSETGKEIMSLQTPVRESKQATQKSTAKKSITKRSRIEKELAIDTVEGHPFLKKQSERLTRKKLIESEKINRRKSFPQKSNKTKTQTKTPKSKEKRILNSHKSFSVTVEETQERNNLPEDAPCSEDVIESSQDSNFTTITVKSTKRTPKHQAVVVVDRIKKTDLKMIGTQDLLVDSDSEMLCVSNESNNQETKDDIELPLNKTAEVDQNHSELTENMDTEPINDEQTDNDVIIIDDDGESPITVSNEKSIRLDTEELAEADTQPIDPADFVAYECNETSQFHPEIQNTPMDITESMSASKLASSAPESQEDVIEISIESNCSEKDTDMCSPYKDDIQRKQDFLNNTSEISPIKVQSPDKDKTSPEKNVETSSDYLVVKLTSPVHSNGEPYSSKGSPEFFTEDKTSPDKRDQSPPRAEVVASNGSPTSSLSLKRNRPQTLRPGGRGAQILGLCIPDSINTKKNSEKAEPEELTKPSTSTPARRNLRVLYNAVNDNSDIVEDNDQDNFLKLKKALPSANSSPAVPILKRKLDIVDDTTSSPASKRKRVSFHDPPVSTTISVQKYIKPGCIESPSTVLKRVEPQMPRSFSKSPKKLENANKLDTILSKAIESFSEQPADSLTNDTNTSLDVTPAVEVVVTSELNDMDPVCPELVDCKDPIENIAVELSSPAMKHLFIKELYGKVLTVGDLAKMSELQVNRLRIKAPKVQVAKKVLGGYHSNKVVTAQDVPLEAIICITDETAIASEINEEMTEPEAVNTAVETQTDKVSVCENASPTGSVIAKLVSTQTTSVSTADTYTQTLESGSKTTFEIITSCLAERPDFIEKIGDLLPADTFIDILINKSNGSTSKLMLTKFLDRQSQNQPNDERNSKELSVTKDFLLERFDHRDLIVFCSRLYQDIYDKKICSDCTHISE